MTNQQFRPVQVVIDRTAIKHNLAKIQALANGAKIIAVIKADAYGHGLEVVAKQLKDVDEFAVNSMDDVQRLRVAGIDKPLHLLSALFDGEQLCMMIRQNVSPVIYDWEQLAILEQLDTEHQLSVWIKVDTGQGRLGFMPEDLPDVIKRVNACTAIAKCSLMSHLSYADTPEHPSNQQQLKLFKQLLNKHQFSRASLLNSGGLVSFSDATFDCVRPGIMLYGISPTIDKTAVDLGLHAVMTFKSKLLSVKRMPSGSSIGYGGTYTLDSDSRVGIVACGYGDGYPRHASNGTPVLINGLIVPLIGRVSMDLLAVDLGELPAEVGDEVILWGAGNPVEEVAKAAGTIAYELCCGILPRVERVVV